MAGTEIVLVNGKKRLLHEGYVYRVECVNKSGSTCWRCVLQQETGCVGRAKTDCEDNVLSATEHPGHMPDSSKCGCVKMKSKASAIAHAAPHQSAASIISAVTEGIPEEQLPTLPSRRNLQRTVWAVRKKARVEAAGAGADESSLENLEIPLELRSLDGEYMLLFDSGPGSDRIVIFGTLQNCKQLEQSEWIACDGTFKVVPPLWSQLWTIHCMEAGFCLPCLYCLLPDKNEQTYARMYSAVAELLDEYPIGKPPQKGLLDFEYGALRATLEFLEPTGGQVYGCLFHMAQNLNKNVRAHGLQTRYAADNEFRLRVKMLVGLAFVKPEAIVEVFGMIREMYQPDELTFLQYFDSTYVTNPRFPHAVWSCYGRHDLGATRSNNSVEAFHRVFAQNIVQGSHVSLWTLIDSIKISQRSVNLDLASIARGEEKKPSRKQATRNARIKTLVEKYTENNDALKLCRGIAYCYMD
eukprot:GEMP01039781.1.p1 GENE.GEMP01039781.1~~GEMP01039781.1.p1  ORF type:complete len:468 (+),score=53.93 GEMP01039781.1:84-1487(+)